MTLLYSDSLESRRWIMFQRSELFKTKLINVYIWISILLSTYLWFIIIIVIQRDDSHLNRVELSDIVTTFLHGRIILERWNVVHLQVEHDHSWLPSKYTFVMILQILFFFWGGGGGYNYHLFTPLATGQQPVSKGPPRTGLPCYDVIMLCHKVMTTITTLAW